MKNLTRILSMALFALIIGFMTPASAEHGEKSDTVAIKYYGEWCGSCKIIDPKLKELKANLSDDLAHEIEFVLFDMTNDDTKAASKIFAAEQGLAAHYSDDAKTGRLVIIDRESGNILAVFKKDLSVEEMHGALKAIAQRG